jgi:CHASE3 domain sensor protein
MPFSSPNAPAAFRRILSRNLLLPLGLGIASALVFLLLLSYLVDALKEVERSDQVLQRAANVQKLDLDMESGVRGYLAGGADERFLQPYQKAVETIGTELQKLREQVRDNREQVERLERIEALQAKWQANAQDRIRAKREAPASVVDGAIGLDLKEGVREEFDEFLRVERRARLDRTQAANRNTTLGATAFVLLMLAVGIGVAWRGRRDLMGLSETYETALQDQVRQSEAVQAFAWLREGQSRLGQRLANEQELAGVGHGALEAARAAPLHERREQRGRDDDHWGRGQYCQGARPASGDRGGRLSRRLAGGLRQEIPDLRRAVRQRDQFSRRATPSGQRLADPLSGSLTMCVDYAERAKALVGTRFRPQGRSALGLDCVGLVLTALDIPAAEVRRNYSLRGDHRAELEEALDRFLGRVGDAAAQPGDVMLLQAGTDQLHLAVRTTAGFVHAHAGIGRVVETPGQPQWPILGNYRKRRG